MTVNRLPWNAKSDAMDALVWRFVLITGFMVDSGIFNGVAIT